MTTTTELKRVAQISTRDVTAPAGADYGEPHPSIWATETVTRDDWEVVAYRRELGRKEVSGSVVVATLEQTAEPDAFPRVVIDGPARFEFDARTDIGEPSAWGMLDRAFNYSSESQRFTADRFSRRLRPGILEILADALDVEGDEELASAVSAIQYDYGNYRMTHAIDVFTLTLLRNGFNPFAGLATWPLEKALVAVGLARHGHHADQLLVTSR